VRRVISSLFSLGLGNWPDRVLHEGSVTDFVSVGVGRFRTRVFDLADVAVVAGVELLVWLTGCRASVPREEGV
jgi:signal peptidase II